MGVCAGTSEPVGVDDQLGPVGRLTLHTCVQQFLQRLHQTQKQEAFVQSKTAAKRSTAVLIAFIYVGQFQAGLILCTVLPVAWVCSAASIRRVVFQRRRLKLRSYGMCTGAASDHKQLHNEELNTLGVCVAAYCNACRCCNMLGADGNSSSSTRPFAGICAGGRMSGLVLATMHHVMIRCTL